MDDREPSLITREQALALGLKKYFTGEPCVHGHVCERKTRRRECVECLKRIQRKTRAKNRDNYLSYHRERLHKRRVAQWVARAEHESLRSLWAAVLRRACEDASGRNLNWNDKPKMRRYIGLARAWLTEEPNPVRALACDALGLDERMLVEWTRSLPS